MSEQASIPGDKAAEARVAIKQAQEALQRAAEALRPPRGIRDEGGD